MKPRQARPPTLQTHTREAPGRPPLLQRLEPDFWYKGLTKLPLPRLARAARRPRLPAGTALPESAGPARFAGGGNGRRAQPHRGAKREGPAVRRLKKPQDRLPAAPQGRSRRGVPARERRIPKC